MAFSADGERIVTGSRDGTVQVWDASTGQETLNLDGHGDSVRSVAFAADGKHIVSGSDDKTKCVWDALLQGRRPGSSRGTVTPSVAWRSPRMACIMSEVPGRWG